MIEVHAEFPQREVIQANAVVDNEEKTVSEVIISAKPKITGVTASVDNETGTPYVDVTETGTGTDFSFDLAFHNLKGDKGDTGATGQTGQDGFSPSVTVEQTEAGATITATDKDGTTSANIYNGADGQDGFSPIATVEPIQDGAKITITDKDGTTTTNVYNGTDGTDGADGQAATVTVGTTTTGAAGTNASVVNSGTSSAAVFDFVIPRGDKGDTGNTGATGNGIVNTEYISSSGLVDTYHVNYTNGGHDSFTVTNGRDGSGSATDVQINGTSITSNNVANILTESAYSSSNKIATMSDLPSGGANTDLSNLTATGESHFLKNIAGGTNSLSILAYGNVNGDNATSIGVNSRALGNGSISLGTDSSNYAKNSIAIGYQANVASLCDSAIQLGYGTNSTAKSLNVGFYDSSTPTNYQLLDGTTGLIPDARISTNIQRTSTAVTHTANTAVGSSTKPIYISSTGAATASTSTVGGSSTPVYLNAGTITSTGLSIANSRFDGQWTWKYQAVENNVTKAVGSYSYALSNYLPDTTNKYEIFVRTRAEYDSALSIYGIGTVASPADNMSLSGQYFFQTYVQGNSKVAASSFILPFNANGTLYYQVKSAKLAGLAIHLCGYRRIGTNT